MMRVFRALIVIVLISIPFTAFTDQITKVGILDIKKVYSVYFKESKSVKDLEKMQNETVKKLKELDEKILYLESEKLKAENDKNGDKALKLDEEIFSKKMHRDDYERIKTDQLRMLSEKLYQSNKFIDELFEAIQYVSESEGFSLILSTEGQLKIFYWTKEIDITEKVIQELMKRAGQSYSGEE